MSSIEKLITRFKTVPSDFTIYELDKLLSYLGYTRKNKGKTSGSRAIYCADDLHDVILHIPHDKIVDQTFLKELKNSLSKEGLI